MSGIFVGLGVLAMGAAAGRAAWQGAAAEKPNYPEYIEAVSTVVKPDRVMPGGKAVLEVTVRIAPEFHINANKPGDENMIPTEFTAVASKPFLKYGAVQYPAPKTVKVDYSPKPLKVYEETAVIRIPITVEKKNATPGKVTVGGSLRVQGCNATSCLPPAKVPVSASLIVNGVK